MPVNPRQYNLVSTSRRSMPTAPGRVARRAARTDLKTLHAGPPPLSAASIEKLKVVPVRNSGYARQEAAARHPVRRPGDSCP